MRRSIIRRFAGVGMGALLGLTACEQKQPPAGSDAPAASANHATPPPAGTPAAPAEPTEADLAALRALVSGKAENDPLAGLPPGHPPLTPPAASAMPRLPAGHPPAAGAAAGGGAAADGPDLRFTTPSGWESQPVRSSLRKAQYGLPRVAGDEEDGELVVFFFGRNEGGAVRDNIERWKGQFTSPDGQPVPPEGAREESFEANGMRITTLDIAGRFSPGPGMGAAGPRDNIRMLAAVIETPDGNWFIRATGPLATMQEHRESFREFLLSVER